MSSTHVGGPPTGMQSWVRGAQQSVRAVHGAPSSRHALAHSSAAVAAGAHTPDSQSPGSAHGSPAPFGLPNPRQRFGGSMGETSSQMPVGPLGQQSPPAQISPVAMQSGVAGGAQRSTPVLSGSQIPEQHDAPSVQISHCWWQPPT